MTRPHHYVHCDVPEGMTLAEYRSTKQAVVKPRRPGLVARLRGRGAQERQPARRKTA